MQSDLKENHHPCINRLTASVEGNLSGRDIMSWGHRTVVEMRGDEFIKGELVGCMAMEDEVEKKHWSDVKACD